MKRADAVLCACCGREFAMHLVEMVRLRHPVWCEVCIANADTALRQAAERAAKVGEVLGER
jgi:hypothetical protein